MTWPSEEGGYGRPPRKHQFKKGESGNPAGRPPRSKNIHSLLALELDRLVSIKENGVELRIPKREAIIRRLANTALSGNHRSIELLLKLAKENGTPDPFQISQADYDAAQAFAERLSKRGDRKGGS